MDCLLNTNTVWKLLGEVCGDGALLKIPSDGYEELHIAMYATHNGLERVYNTIILKDQIDTLTSGNQSVYNVGGYYLSNSDYGLAAINIDNNGTRIGIMIRLFYYAGNNYTSESKMKIRYK